MIKKLLVISGDPNISDLEWKLPFIYQYSKYIGPVEILMPYFQKPQTVTQKFYLYLFKQWKIKVIRNEEFKKFDINSIKIFKFLSNKNLLIKKLLSIEAHWISKITLVRYLRIILLKNNLKAYLKKFNFIFICIYPEISKQVILNSIQKTSYTSDKILIGVPDAPHFEWLHKSVAKYNTIFLSSINQKNDFIKSNPKMNYYISGSPNLSKRWNKKIYNEYNKYLRNNKKIYKTKKNTILFILTKPDHLHWKNISHDDLVLKIILKLIQFKKKIIIKPHPRHNLKKLKNFLKKNKLSKFVQIRTEPISILTNMCKIVVSLPSYGCINPQANNLIPYVIWPIKNKNLFENKKNVEFDKIFLKKKNKKINTIYEKYTYFIDNLQKIPNIKSKNYNKKIKQKNFDEDFLVKKNPLDYFKKFK